MVQLAYLNRKRRCAGPSGAANPAVRRYPTWPGRPLMPALPGDGMQDLPLPLVLAAMPQAALPHAC